MFSAPHVGPVDACGERVRVVGRPAREPEHLAALRVEHDRRAVEPRHGERVFYRLLHIGVDGNLQALPFGGPHLLERPDFPTHAVDDDPLRAVLSHEQGVVDLLDPRLPDDVAALESLVLANLRVADLADVPEEMRRQFGRIFARRHRLDHDIGQLEVEAPRGHGRHLGERGILHDGDRAIARFSPVTIDHFADAGFVDVEHFGKQPDRAVHVARMLPRDGDTERVTVLDERPTVAVEHDAARRAQRQRALVVVLGHLLELGVLDYLENPEAEREHREEDRDQVSERRDPRSDATPFFNKRHGKRCPESLSTVLASTLEHPRASNRSTPEAGAG